VVPGGTATFVGAGNDVLAAGGFEDDVGARVDDALGVADDAAVGDVGDVALVGDVDDVVDVAVGDVGDVVDVALVDDVDDVVGAADVDADGDIAAVEGIADAVEGVADADRVGLQAVASSRIQQRMLLKRSRRRKTEAHPYEFRRLATWRIPC
jgi:hypothetical protein